MKQRQITIYFFFISLIIWAQEPVSIHLTEVNGLPDIEFYDAIEDLENNIWLAGNKGLFRYDGKEYVSYSHPEKRGRSFFNLKLDHKGRLWFNNIAGQFFYIENNKIQLFVDVQNRLNGALADYEIHEKYLLIRVPKATIWIDIKTKEVVYTTPNVSGTNIGYIENNRYYYVANENKFQYQDLDTKEVHKVVKTPLNLTKKYPGFTHFYKVSEGYLLLFQSKIGDQKSLYHIHNETLTPLQLPTELQKIRIQVIQEFDKLFYFATMNGIFVAKRSGNQLKVITHYLQSYAATEIIKDFQDNLWIPTLSNGVFVIPNEGLQAISNERRDITVLEKKTDSTYFMGNKKGNIQLVNLKGTIKETYNFNDISTIRTLDYNPTTKILYCNSDKQFLKYHTEKKTINRIQKRSAAKSISHIKDDLYLQSYAHGTFYGNDEKLKEINPKRAYKSIYSKQKNKAYIANIDGLLVYDSVFNFQKLIQHQGKPVFSFDIEEAIDGTIWTATYDNGVLGIKNDEVVAVLNTENGLASKAINKIKTDGKNLWIVTDNGLQYYKSDTKTFQTLNKRDGLLSYNINNIEIFGNEVVFSANIGMFRFNKLTIFKEWNTPQAYFTNVHLEETQVPLAAKYSIKQQQSEIEIRFNSKGFQSDKFVTYEYQLKGFNDSWNTVDKGQLAVKFNTLPAGNFTFNLRAKNVGGTQYSEIKSIQFNITLPFWKQAWFIACIMLAIIALVILYFRRKIRIRETQKNKELQQLEIDKQLVNLRLENLRSQMNPHFIFNALNSIQEYIVLNQQSLASTYLVKFSRLIRTYLEQSQEKEITLDQELKALNLYLELEKVRFEEELSYTVSIAENLALESIKIPSLFIQPYIENAIKHGLHHKIDNRKLEVTFKKENEQLLCEITDNGIGREAAQKLKENQAHYYKSFATRANTERVELINKDRLEKIKVNISDLTNENNQPTGTRVSIKIPLKK
ncbi:histidine kinase [Kordia sp.]|uniref:sensor histidine kinase n=1 Tax=Kordia sp. TaxID=1965332 RepID=UPI003B5C5F2A